MCETVDEMLLSLLALQATVYDAAGYVDKRDKMAYIVRCTKSTHP